MHTVTRKRHVVHIHQGYVSECVIIITQKAAIALERVNRTEILSMLGSYTYVAT